MEVSLQPWRNYQTDGCILFSDIMTPLPGMGVEFDIGEKVGPVVEPMRCWDDIKKVRDFLLLMYCLFCCIGILSHMVISKGTTKI